MRWRHEQITQDWQTLHQEVSQYGTNAGKTRDNEHNDKQNTQQPLSVYGHHRYYVSAVAPSLNLARCRRHCLGLFKQAVSTNEKSRPTHECATAVQCMTSCRMTHTDTAPVTTAYLTWDRRRSTFLRIGYRSSSINKAKIHSIVFTL